MTKKCFKCNNVKPLLDFYKHPQMPDGHVGKCKECNKKDVKDNSILKKEYYRNYDKDRIRNNFNYIFLHKYSGIKNRSMKKMKNNYSSCGKKYCTKDEFLNWCNEFENMKIFKKLWKKWKNNNFDRKFAPSIDRINNNIGYELSNIRWLSLSENCKKHKK